MSSLLKKVKYAAKTAKDVAKAAVAGEELAGGPELATKRMEICRKCPKLGSLLGKDQCNECGCILNLKVTLKDAECPLKHW